MCVGVLCLLCHNLGDVGKLFNLSKRYVFLLNQNMHGNSNVIETSMRTAINFSLAIKYLANTNCNSYSFGNYKMKMRNIYWIFIILERHS
jgi:hypothetical protein